MAAIDIYGDAWSGSGSSSGVLDQVNAGYRAALHSLLPRGPAWNTRNGSELSELSEALSYEFSRLGIRVQDLFNEADPSTATELLSDWERLTELDAGSQTLAERQAAVVAHLQGAGDPTAVLLLAALAVIGYDTAEILRYRPFVAGDPVGKPLYNEAWAYHFNLLYHPGTQDAAVAALTAVYTLLHNTSGVIAAYGAWLPRTHDTYAGTFYAIERCTPAWVAVGSSGEIQTSSLGKEWTTQTPDLGYGASFNGVAYGAGLCVIVGAVGEIQTSPDAETWTHRANDGAFGGTFRMLAFGNSLFVTAGSAGEIQTSANGTAWTARTADGGFSDDFWGAAYGAGLWCLVGDNGEIQTSADGITWAQRSAAGGYSGDFNAVTFNGSVFVAVGASGEIQTSPDAINWTSRDPDGTYTDDWDSVTSSLIDGVVIATGKATQLEIQTSADNGETWHRRAHDTETASLYGSAADAFGLVIAVGSAGVTDKIFSCDREEF